jgi:hypothetical protein
MFENINERTLKQSAVVVVVLFTIHTVAFGNPGELSFVEGITAGQIVLKTTLILFGLAALAASAYFGALLAASFAARMRRHSSSGRFWYDAGQSARAAQGVTAELYGRAVHALRSVRSHTPVSIPGVGNTTHDHLRS